MSDRSVWRLEDEVDRLRDEVARLRLTADERAAIELAAACAEDDTTTATAETGRRVATTLRGLLERLGDKECTS